MTLPRISLPSEDWTRIPLSFPWSARPVRADVVALDRHAGRADQDDAGAAELDDAQAADLATSRARRQGQAVDVAGRGPVDDDPGCPTAEGFGRRIKDDLPVMSGRAVVSAIVCGPLPAIEKSIVSAPELPLASVIASRRLPAPASFVVVTVNVAARTGVGVVVSRPAVATMAAIHTASAGEAWRPRRPRGRDRCSPWVDDGRNSTCPTSDARAPIRDKNGPAPQTGKVTRNRLWCNR